MAHSSSNQGKQPLPTLIIGAGWAGIGAAVAEVQAGRSVVLVEERPYLGGRARSFVHRETGDEIDNGQHVMMGCYRDFLHIVRTLGTEHLLERQRALSVAFVDQTGKVDVLDGSLLPGKAGIALGLLRMRGIRLASRMRGLQLALKLSFGLVTGKGLTCAEFLERHKQPSDIVSRFWEPIVLATLNAPIHLADASLLVNVMRLAFLGKTTDSQLLIPRSGLSALIDPLPHWLEQNQSDVLTSTSVSRLTIVGESVVSALMASGESIEVANVICCLPRRALDRLLEASSLEPIPIEPEEFSPIISVYLWYTDAWMPFDFVSALGTTVQWIFDKRRISPGLVALTVSAGHSMVSENSDEIISACDSELRALFPDRMRLAGLRHALVIKEKMATPLFTPEANLQRIGCLTPIASNLFLAGDWTQTGLPATIEGAVRSGIYASTCVQSQQA